MKTTHKIIKYLAIAFAVMIIAGIASAVVSIAGGVGIGVGIGYIGSNTDPEKVFSGSEESVLYIEIAASKVKISDGAELSGNTDNEYISVEVRGDKLVATEQKHSAIKSNETYLDITVPADMVFDRIVIKTGAGVVEASTLRAKDLELELGAGEVTIGELVVFGEADIEGGAGEITVSGGDINNLDANLGVGEANIRAMLSGECDIEAGVGELKLTLLGNRDDYKIKVATGIGEFKLDNEKITGDKTVGNGSNSVEIDAGIGSVDVWFE